MDFDPKIVATTMRYMADFYAFATDSLGHKDNVEVGYKDLTKEHSE